MDFKLIYLARRDPAGGLPARLAPVAAGQVMRHQDDEGDQQRPADGGDDDGDHRRARGFAEPEAGSGDPTLIAVAHRLEGGSSQFAPPTAIGPRPGAMIAEPDHLP